MNKSHVFKVAILLIFFALSSPAQNVQDLGYFLAKTIIINELDLHANPSEIENHWAESCQLYINEQDNSGFVGCFIGALALAKDLRREARTVMELINPMQGFLERIAPCAGMLSVLGVLYEFYSLLKQEWIRDLVEDAGLFRESLEVAKTYLAAIDNYPTEDDGYYLNRLRELKAQRN